MPELLVTKRGSSPEMSRWKELMLQRLPEDLLAVSLLAKQLKARACDATSESCVEGAVVSHIHEGLQLGSRGKPFAVYLIAWKLRDTEECEWQILFHIWIAGYTNFNRREP
ncbi:hypothetical protein Ancab_011984 [Ancistrocladus abbreviatus]